MLVSGDKPAWSCLAKTSINRELLLISFWLLQTTGDVVISCHFMWLYVTLSSPATVTLFICSYLDIFFVRDLPFFLNKPNVVKWITNACLLYCWQHWPPPSWLFVPKPLNPDTMSYRMTFLQNRWKIRNGLRQRLFLTHWWPHRHLKPPLALPDIPQMNNCKNMSSGKCHFWPHWHPTKPSMHFVVGVHIKQGGYLFNQDVLLAFFLASCFLSKSTTLRYHGISMGIFYKWLSAWFLLLVCTRLMHSIKRMFFLLSTSQRIP